MIYQQLMKVKHFSKTNMFKALGIFLIESSGIPKAQTQHSAPDTKSAEQSGENIWQQGCNK